MSSLNQCQFIGRLGADPEIRTLNNGTRCANMNVAVSERWKDKNSGETKENTEWVRVVVFQDGLVGIVERYVNKGDMIYISGKMKTRKWEKDGVERYSTEIVLNGFDAKVVLLGGKKDGDNGGGGGQRSSGGGGGGGFSQGGSGGGQKREAFSADLDDDIPFLTRKTIW